MTGPEILKIIKRITYKDWTVVLTDLPDGLFTIHVLFMAPCAVTGKPMIQQGRLWLLSDDITEDGVIKTVFSAIKQAEEHELMEFFTVDGMAVFSPHISIQSHKIGWLAMQEGN